MADQGSGTNCTGADMARMLVAGLVGAVIGASIGLLLAPKPGVELRSDIREKAGTAAEKAHVVQAKAKDLVEAAKHRIEERRHAPEPEATTTPEPA